MPTARAAAAAAQQQHADVALEMLDDGAAYLQRSLGSTPQQVLSREGGDLLMQQINYLVIAWALEVRASIDQQTHVFGVLALYLVADFWLALVRWRAEQLASRPEFQRRTLASAVVRAASLAVVFFGFIMVRLVVDTFQRQTQFSRRSTLLNFVFPATLFCLLYINQTFSSYYSLGPPGPWSDALEQSWRLRHGNVAMALQQ